MKMEIKDVISRYVGIEKLVTKKLPVRLSYAIACNIEILQKEYKRVDAINKQLIEQYAKRDDNGELIVVDQNGTLMYDIGDNKGAFDKEFDDFLNSEVDIEIRTVSEDLIDKCDDPKYDALSTEEVSSLLFMIN